MWFMGLALSRLMTLTSGFSVSTPSMSSYAAIVSMFRSLSLMMMVLLSGFFCKDNDVAAFMRAGGA